MNPSALIREHESILQRESTLQRVLPPFGVRLRRMDWLALTLLGLIRNITVAYFFLVNTYPVVI